MYNFSEDKQQKYKSFTGFRLRNHKLSIDSFSKRDDRIWLNEKNVTRIEFE